jgi:hypothetical protein
VAKLEYLGITNLNCLHKESKSRLHLRTTSYHFIPNLLSFHLPFKNMKIKIYKIIILPVV